MCPQLHLRSLGSTFPIGLPKALLERSYGEGACGWKQRLACPFSNLGRRSSCVSIAISRDKPLLPPYLLAGIDTHGSYLNAIVIILYFTLTLVLTGFYKLLPQQAAILHNRSLYYFLGHESNRTNSMQHLAIGWLARGSSGEL